MKKLLYVIAAALCLVACESNAPEGGDYVDLGLSSGTKWKSQNELNPNGPKHDFFTYDEAMATFGKNLPTKEQWMELKKECTWNWTGTGSKVIGPNGNFITLPAAGFLYPDGHVDGKGSGGGYWSSTLDGSGNAWYLSFYYWTDTPNTGYYYGRSGGLSVRLVR